MDDWIFERKLDGCDVTALPFRTHRSLLRRILRFENPLRYAGKVGTGFGGLQLERLGWLRHPRFLGLRDDKDPADVVRERPQKRKSGS